MPSIGSYMAAGIHTFPDGRRRNGWLTTRNAHASLNNPPCRFLEGLELNPHPHKTGHHLPQTNPDGLLLLKALYRHNVLSL